MQVLSRATVLELQAERGRASDLRRVAVSRKPWPSSLRLPAYLCQGDRPHILLPCSPVTVGLSLPWFPHYCSRVWTTRPLRA